MKTRYGLVSNSSSSSFICLMTEEVHSTILEKLEKLEIEYETKEALMGKRFLDNYVRKVKKFGKDLRLFILNEGEAYTYEMCNHVELVKSIFTEDEFEDLSEKVDVEDFICVCRHNYEETLQEIKEKNLDSIFEYSDQY